MLFASGQPLQPGPMFVGRGRSPSKSGAPENCFTQIGTGRAQKTLDKAGRPTGDKQSSLLRTLVNYGRFIKHFSLSLM
jgi:hypothetical protein